MAIKKTKSGYQVRWYDADGRERKRTYKRITRLEAEKTNGTCWSNGIGGNDRLMCGKFRLSARLLPRGWKNGARAGSLPPCRSISRYSRVSSCQRFGTFA